MGAKPKHQETFKNMQKKHAKNIQKNMQKQRALKRNT